MDKMSHCEPSPTAGAADEPALMMWGQLRLAAGVIQVQVTMHPATGSGWKLVVQHKGRERVIDLESNIRNVGNQLIAQGPNVAPPVEDRTFYRDARGNWMSLGQQKGKWRVFIRCEWDGRTDAFYVGTVERAQDYATAAVALQRFAKLKRWRSFSHQQYLSAIAETKED